MEIADFLRGARKRLWILIVVPLIAAGAAAVLVLQTPPQFTSTSTVSPPALIGGAASNQYTGSQAVSQYVAAFQSNAQGPIVRQAVADKLGVSGGEIAAGLEVSQVGASSAMTVSFTDSRRDIVEPVVAEVARETLQRMFASQVSLAEAQVDSARSQLAAANKDISSWETDHDMVAPSLVYQSQLDLVNSLKQRQITMEASGDQVGAAVVATKLSDAQAKLASFGPLLSDYDSLTAARDAATAALAQAQLSVQQAQAQQAAADPTKVAYISGAHPVDRGSMFLTKVAPVTAAGIFIAVFLVAVLELLARPREEQRTSGGEGRPHGYRSEQLQPEPLSRVNV